ncbi:TetR/AcrR family transcriptional regulator [Leucobacter chromiireducens]|uniref:TetR/AcrR family transcriptional regulator n=1 Tax=Leucobacter chromiireducens subsp. chromiireducens TaxID=660067 RepID=A0ABS1ST83_9MICO|nr:TetR/AcrR family transcriptional regulator [Leucobacter chromiireducens]MBL3690392.1 TetR/AcrR family transcriptional regulator [Leucobacter chromiireducens subsp. chromiireducens]
MAGAEGESYRERTRSSARVSRDARALRTRARLIEAAEALAIEGPEALTAARVSAAAGVSRSAFYVHFDSVTELVSALLLERVHRFGVTFQAEWPDSDWRNTLRAGVREWVAQYDEHRALILAVRRLPGAQQVVSGGVQLLVDILIDVLELHPRRPDGVDIQVVARWIAGGSFGVLDAWLEGELDVDAEQLTDHMLDLCPEWYWVAG